MPSRSVDFDVSRVAPLSHLTLQRPFRIFRAMIDGPPGTFDSDIARVRLVLMRELETISVYEALARDAQGAEAKAFFEHLALEEKEHVAEAMYLLRKLDADQATKFQATYDEAHFQRAGTPSEGGAPAPAVEKQQPAPPDLGAAPKPFIPEELRIPAEPGRALYALPAASSAIAGEFTVGPLKPKR